MEILVFPTLRAFDLPAASVTCVANERWHVFHVIMVGACRELSNVQSSGWVGNANLVIGQCTPSKICLVGTLHTCSMRSPMNDCFYDR